MSPTAGLLESNQIDTLVAKINSFGTYNKFNKETFTFDNLEKLFFELQQVTKEDFKHQSLGVDSLANKFVEFFGELDISQIYGLTTDPQKKIDVLISFQKATTNIINMYDSMLEHDEFSSNKVAADSVELKIKLFTLNSKIDITILKDKIKDPIVLSLLEIAKQTTIKGISQNIDALIISSRDTLAGVKLDQKDIVSSAASVLVAMLTHSKIDCYIDDNKKVITHEIVNNPFYNVISNLIGYILILNLKGL